jgi:3-dehydroquinate dehydratase type I
LEIVKKDYSQKGLKMNLIWNQKAICCLIPSVDLPKLPLLLEIAQQEGAKFLQIEVPDNYQNLTSELFTNKLKIITAVKWTKSDADKKEENIDKCIRKAQKLLDYQPYAIELPAFISKEKLCKLKEESNGLGVKIIGAHYFNSFPDQKTLKKKISGLAKYDYDFIKLVAPAQNIHQNQTMLSLYEKSKVNTLIALCSGPNGKLSQMLAPFLGAPFTYAFLTRKMPEGQIGLAYLRKALQVLEETI